MARDLLGSGRDKLAPKLRMIANGSSEVNSVRSEACAGLRVVDPALLRTAVVRLAPAADGAEPPGRLPPRGKLRAIPSGVEVNVFVHLTDPAAQAVRVPGQLARNGDIVSSRVHLDQLPELAASTDVAYVEIGETVHRPSPVLSEGTPATPTVALRRFGKVSEHHFGENMLVGVIDVGGFDFSHPDFLNSDGTTRFIKIWDQGGDARPSPVAAQFSYGAEFAKAHLDAAIASAPGLGVLPFEVERQSQMSEGSHGTHVASTMAGNRGICRRSPIAAVLVSLPESDEDRRRSFYDSTRIADAVDYLVATAQELGMAVSINISLGTNGHAHDGAGAIGRWIDSVLTTPGRAVTVAAGNAGQEKGETPDDVGWIMGRVHTAGKIPAAGLAVDLDWVVVGNGTVDISENELELWFSPQDRVEVSIRPPGSTWIGPIKPREFIENRRLDDGSFISVYNDLYHPANGANYIGLYLSPNLRANPVVGVPAGTWTVRIHGIEIRDGRFDGWIERDDPQPRGQIGPKRFWSFPSFFSERSTVDNSTVSSLACGHRVITAANLDEPNNRINISSSQGPTRDGRYKPDVAAPGTDIVAAKGFSTDNSAWIGMTGTSMASPYVAGVAGLMLAISPKLTAAQIEGIMRSTAQPLPGGAFGWVNDAGFGVLDPERCLEEAARIDHRTDKTKP
jgi:subtilisin family serine protease